MDSHILMWLARGEPRLSTRVLDRLSDPAVDLFVSSAGVAELCLKASLGKLSLPFLQDEDVEAKFTQLLDDFGASALDVTLAHAVRLRDLPLHHRDPFDRLMIAQALAEGLTIVTHDRAFARYDGLAVLWA
jgi:PIN domain nuclease of toxin-antitoxin system